MMQFIYYSLHHSEERFEKSLMEDEDCTFIIQPKHNKKRKLSAIRDFPEGCGPFASTIDPNTFAQSNELSLKLDMEDLEDTELTSAVKVVECDSSYMSKSSSEEVVLCAGSEFSSSDVNISRLKKAKRRIVEVVRDFCPLCGSCAYFFAESEYGSTHQACRLQAIENDNSDTVAEEVGSNF
ncbi:hypothetical protein CR513_29790, partial [Mucuna pruriens]